ncbi:MAG: ATP-binding protein, partial [Opitutales bacterium]
MAPNTSLGFVFLGAALLCLDNSPRKGPRPAEALALLIGILALLALIGYAYQIEQLFGIGAFIPMALHTAGVFFVLAIGLLFARPNSGLMEVVTSTSPGGILVRRLFPAMILALTVLGWLRLEGSRRGFYSDEFGVTLYTIANITIFGGLVASSARSLHRADVVRSRSEAEKERFFTLSLDLLGIASTSGYFTRLNPAFSETLGHSIQTMLERPFTEFVHPEDRERTLTEMEKLKQGEGSVSFQNRYRCRDGSWKWLSWKMQPFLEEGLLYATARDVTQEKKTEAEIQQLNADLQTRAAELEAANGELESFSYSVSHDLRAPLRHIHGYVEMLTKATEGQLGEKPQRYLRTIAEASGEMGQLIDDLLSFSRMARIEMSEGVVNLNELVEEVLRGLEMATRERKVEWTVASLPEVHGDRAMLKQALANLMENAVKYTRQRDCATVEIGCSEERAEWVTLFVRDNGAGFDMRYVHKLFGVFQRLHRGDEFEGTGIGLANVRRIISRHGGQTWAEGEPDKGATFSLTLKTANTQDQ